MTTEKPNMENLRKQLITMRAQFKMALPAHITVEKFERTVITAAQNAPKLAICDRGSFWAACLKAASDGLLPDGRECAIVPFRDKESGTYMAQYIQMVGGVLKLIRNSGELSSISPNIVYEKDQFEHWVDEKGEHFNHRPSLEENAGKPLFVYCLARLKDDSVYFEKMTRNQVEAVKSMSRAKGSLKWGKFWEEGWKVAVIKRIGKRLPASTDIDPSLFKDDEYDFEEDDAPEESAALPEAPATQSKRLKAAVTDEKPPEPKPEPPPRQREPGDDDEPVEEETPL